VHKHTKLKTTSTGNNAFLIHITQKTIEIRLATSIQIYGSGQIVRLILGAIRFRLDYKNCYPVHH